MSDTRSAMLHRIRTAREDIDASAAITRDYRRDSDRTRAELVALFTERLHDYGTEVHPTGEHDLRQRLVELLDGRDCVVPPGLPADWLPPGARIDDPPLPTVMLDSAGAVITGSAVACAETGTIALDGGPGQGRRALTLVPDWHICVVRTEHIVHTVPQLLARLVPTRPTTLVSGPSATSDIELHRVKGVHGPRTLTVVLLDSAPTGRDDAPRERVPTTDPL